MEPDFTPGQHKSFWRHLKGCDVPICTKADYADRVRILAELEDRVRSGRYRTGDILGFLVCAKKSGVPRFVPVFGLADYAVYYACVSALDKDLARQRIEGTFGGWRLGGSRRESEKPEIDAARDTDPESMPDESAASIDVDILMYASAPVAAYNPREWVAVWNEFWSLAHSTWTEAPAESWFVELDIANFYDSVDLLRLEREVRRAAPDSALAVELLFYFLSTWNRSLHQYGQVSRGVPQDLIGDCSRVLANFYLTPADSRIRDRVASTGCAFMRFADDMIVRAPTKRAASEAVFIIGEELHRIGLHLNASKVAMWKKDDFHTAWGFDLMTRIAHDVPARDVAAAVTEAIQRDATGRFRRNKTVLRRALTVLAAASQEPALGPIRAAVHDHFTRDAGLLRDLTSYQIRALCQLSSDPDLTFRSIADEVLAFPFTQGILHLRCVACDMAAQGRLRSDTGLAVVRAADAALRERGAGWVADLLAPCMTAAPPRDQAIRSNSSRGDVSAILTADDSNDRIASVKVVSSEDQRIPS